MLPNLFQTPLEHPCGSGVIKSRSSLWPEATGPWGLRLPQPPSSFLPSLWPHWLRGSELLQSDSNCGPRISARSSVSLIYHTLARETESKQLEVTVAVCQNNLMLLRLYRCALLYCTVLEIEGSWQLYWRHCPNSMCSLHPSASHVGNSCNISNFFTPILFVMMICDQWSLMLLLWLAKGSDDG